MELAFVYTRKAAPALPAHGELVSASHGGYRGVSSVHRGRPDGQRVVGDPVGPLLAASAPHTAVAIARHTSRRPERLSPAETTPSFTTRVHDALEARARMMRVNHDHHRLRFVDLVFVGASCRRRSANANAQDDFPQPLSRFRITELGTRPCDGL